MTEELLPSMSAFILHADVAGSTALVQRDEQLAHNRILEAFHHLSHSVEKYKGKVLELRGDALLAEFDRASDAVAAALAFQVEHSYRLSQIKDDIKPAIRVGVAMGEVVIADDTVTGAGVVLAQRVEQLALPGGLCITEALHEALPRRLPFELENMGEQVLKGFDDAVRVYRVELRPGESLPPPQQKSRRRVTTKPWGLMVAIAGVLALIGWGIIYLPEYSVPWEKSAAPEPVVITPSDRPSIAVLPFINLSGDEAQEYFVDGMTEDLITDLSKVSGLLVIARNSTFTYKGRAVNVREVGRELGTRYVLEGSVRKIGNRVRINAQLIETESGFHVWADRFDRDMTDVFALQDEVTRSIVSILAVRLTGDEQQRRNQRRITSPEAYDTLLRGLEFLRRFTLETNLIAREYFERAVELDPNYARALANISFTYANEVNLESSPGREVALQQALQYARQALALDPTVPQVHFSLSVAYVWLKEHDLALAAALKAVEVDPNYADGYVQVAFVHLAEGKPEQALEALQTARQLNPLYSFFYLTNEGRAYFALREYDKAAKLFEESLERNPDFTFARMFLMATYAHMGRLDDANWEVQEALTISPNFTIANETARMAYKKFGRPETLHRWFAQGRITRIILGTAPLSIV
ncbi:MAG: tetratricopeptide repeat protein [Gammaproteobacteria bacterium]|nr:tetratricopeptide repeat protein [Gammaproteobacteria bacterium]